MSLVSGHTASDGVPLEAAGGLERSARSGTQ